MKFKVMSLAMVLGLGLSSCFIMDKQDGAGVRFSQKNCSTVDVTNANLTFNAANYGTSEMRIYDSGRLVVDTCSTTPVPGTPQYSLMSIGGTTQKVIFVIFPDHNIPTTGSLSLMVAGNCASTFVQAGTATFDYNAIQINSDSTVPNCKVLNGFVSNQTISFK